MQLLALLCASLAGATLVRAACSIVEDVHVTSYGSPDNDPPDSITTAYDCKGRDYEAGGMGTYEDPLTFASTEREYDQCEIIYSPYLKKYLVLQDTCAACTGDNPTDVFTGNAQSGGEAQIECENALTPEELQNIIRKPSTDLEVDTTPLWTTSSRKCNTGHTYPDNDPDESC